MTLRVAFLHAARRDFEDAALWYEERRSGLGAEFRAEVDAAVALAAEQPLRFAVDHPEHRSSCSATQARVSDIRLTTLSADQGGRRLCTGTRWAQLRWHWPRPPPPRPSGEGLDIQMTYIY